MDFRKSIILGLAACVSLGAWAVPAKKGVRTIRQADGSVISVELIGDEFSHAYTTTDGLAVIRLGDGNFHYRTADGASGVIAHNAGARTAAEQAFVKDNARSLAPAAVMKSVRGRAGARKAPQRGVRRKASQVPSSGSPRVPVILVQYKDYKFKDTDANATFTSFFTEGEKSAHQYFVDQSNGKYTPQFDVYGPVTLSGKRVAYGGNDDYGNDVGVGTMVAEGCQGLNQEIDFSRYDNDGDGECDVVIVLYAGDGEASSYDEDAEDAVWPCQWSLSGSDYGRHLALDGTVVNRFAVFNELNGADLKKIDGVGTFCHEFSHCLDLPDFYDTQYGPHFGMGPWSLMDYGCYNDDGYTPIGYSAYEKAFMGWIDLEEGQENTYYTLPELNQGAADTDKAMRLTNPKDKNEYYILENRGRQKWDRHMPAEGLLITHVTYDDTAWLYNEVNDYDMQRMTPVPADNKLKLYSYNSGGQIMYSFDRDDVSTDLWPQSGATELTDTSTPAAEVNTGSFLGKPVTEITANDDGTVSFWVMKAPKPTVSKPVNVGHKVESTTSATIYWEAGDETDVTYTVEVEKHRDVTYNLVSSTDFTQSGHDWSEDGFTEISSDGIRLGSSNRIGSVESPTFRTSTDGIVTVNFNARYYSGDESSLMITLYGNNGIAAGTKTVKLTAQPAEYTTVFSGNPNVTSYVKIETLTSKKRAYISRVDIYTGDASELVATPEGAPGKRADENFTRTIEGITATSVLVSDLPENETFDYRVKAVPADGESYSESPWSEFGNFTLDSLNGAEELPADGDAEAVFFTLQGFRINGLPAERGVYIMKQGRKASKVRVL